MLPVAVRLFRLIFCEKSKSIGTAIADQRPVSIAVPLPAIVRLGEQEADSYGLF